MPELYIPQTETFDYDDVMLVPKTGVVKSRSEVDVTAVLGSHRFALPVIPANMSTIVDETTVEWLAERNYFYVMHRFDVDAWLFTKNMHSKGLIASISLGIKPVDYETVDRFAEEGDIPEFVTVDVAHGDSEEVFRMVRYLKTKLDTFIIAGNIATAEAAVRLAEAGADAVKVGVAPGSVCLTGPNTGFGSRDWQLSAVAHVSKALEGRDVRIIADGGIRKYGDIAKSVAFGADFIMIGGMFAGHDENPGDFVEIDGEFKKAFFGSASEFQKGAEKHVEGMKTFVPYKGSLENTLRVISENLQSSVSYAGGRELLDLRDVQYVKLR